MKFCKRLCMKMGWAKLKASIIIVGPHNSGKTTIVHTLSKDPSEAVAPTVGFSVDTFTWRKMKLKVMDMSGQSKYQSIWEHYYMEAQAVVFVVDAADPSSLPEARSALFSVLSHPKVKGLPLLLLCNKGDVAGCMETHEVEMGLGVHELKGWDIKVLGCSAIRNEGLEDGLMWLCKRVQSNL